MEILIILVLYGVVSAVVFGVVSAVVATNKGRSGWGYFALGTILGPLGFILAIVVPKNELVLEKDAIAFGGMKKCAYCSELIKVEAIRCRFCGTDLPRQVEIQRANEQLLNENRSAAGPMSEEDLIELIHKHYSACESLKCRYYVHKLLQEHPKSLYAEFATTRLSELDKKLGIETALDRRDA